MVNTLGEGRHCYMQRRMWNRFWCLVEGPMTVPVKPTGIAVLNGHCPFKILPFPLNLSKLRLNFFALIHSPCLSF